MDICAAAYIHEEEMKRETERELRDREFWISMFGGKSSVEQKDTILEEEMSASALGSR